jgi:glycosyltransferase involved in cell wall biosynthesis
VRIAYISQSTLPSRAANSVHVMKMCQAFAANGHDVALWGLRLRKESFGEGASIFDLYGVQESFSVFRLLHVRGLYRLYALRAVLAARRWGPDIVYCRCIFSARLAAKMGLAVYFEAHHPMDRDGRKERAFRQLIASASLKKLVFITRALEAFYKRAYPGIACETVVAPDGADPVPEVSDVEQAPIGRFHVGYVGQLYRGKGMEIIPRLAEQCPWAEFSVVGGEENAVADWRDKCRHLSNLRFVGFVPHGEVHRHIAKFDAVLLPNQRFVGVAGNSSLNISDWASPLKAFEYMAAGRAIVCSDLPVLREIFEDGINALLCDPEDVDQWCLALRRLSAEPDLRLKLGRNAKQDFQTRYSWSARARRVLDSPV